MSSPVIHVVDDEAHIVRAVKLKLQKAGYTVVGTSNGREAWESIQASVPSLLITDHQMPYMTGEELCRMLRSNEATKHVPIIMLTAKGLEIEEERFAMEFQLHRVMWKPFSPRELIRCVEDALAGRSASEEGEVPQSGIVASAKPVVDARAFFARTNLFATPADQTNGLERDSN